MQHHSTKAWIERGVPSQLVNSGSVLHVSDPVAPVATKTSVLAAQPMPKLHKTEMGLFSGGLPSRHLLRKLVISLPIEGSRSEVL